MRSLQIANIAEKDLKFTATARLLLDKFECHIFYVSFEETFLGE